MTNDPVLHERDVARKLYIKFKRLAKISRDRKNSALAAQGCMLSFAVREWATEAAYEAAAEEVKKSFKLPKMQGAEP